MDRFIQDWQIYWTSPGFAHSNNPVENYNNIIKTHFLTRIKFHMKPILEKFEEIILYESIEMISLYQIKLK